MARDQNIPDKIAQMNVRSSAKFECARKHSQEAAAQGTLALIDGACRRSEGEAAMNKIYVALGGLASVVLLTSADASAFWMGRMGVGPPRAFGMGGLRPGGFRGFSPGVSRGLSPGGFRGFSPGVSRGLRPGGFRTVGPGGYRVGPGAFRTVSPGGFRGSSPNGYRPMIGQKSRMTAPALPSQFRNANIGKLQGQRISQVARGGKISPGISPPKIVSAPGRAGASGRPSVTGPGASGLSAPGGAGASGPFAGGPGLSSAGSSYYGAGSYTPVSYAANNHDAVASAGASECKVIRKKKPTKDGGQRWVLVEQCERERSE
jgi:hypothetical protein